jgi:hypothetical protein
MNLLRRQKTERRKLWYGQLGASENPQVDYSILNNNADKTIIVTLHDPCQILVALALAISLVLLVILWIQCLKSYLRRLVCVSICHYAVYLAYARIQTKTGSVAALMGEKTLKNKQSSVPL